MNFGIILEIAVEDVADLVVKYGKSQRHRAIKLKPFKFSWINNPFK